MSTLHRRRGMKSCIAWLLIVAIFCTSYLATFAFEIKTAFAADSESEQTGDKAFEDLSVDIKSLLDENGYLSDEALHSLETLPYEEEKYTEIKDNDDGSKTLKLYTSPIKYKNDKDEYVYIDNSIVAAPDLKNSYKNKASDIQVIMSDNLDQDGAIEMSVMDYSIKLSL